MKKKIRNRLLGLLVVSLALLALVLGATPLLKAQKEKQQLAEEEKKFAEFFAWRNQ
ncbi:hypothetical protein Lnau_3108 [Legionella nautarum]|uniref:Uncharacterized protein n=1 Tax=Legionella nautarum TaxID=45070 RepID=A0A0W0WIQ9_9GAMM|nr:hypothetical protein [Legionella nautarum]KTD32197.1 hypothetical protein Lnau_3108 [Legionella nautarum]